MMSQWLNSDVLNHGKCNPPRMQLYKCAKIFHFGGLNVDVEHIGECHNNILG